MDSRDAYSTYFTLTMEITFDAALMQVYLHVVPRELQSV